MKKSTKPPKIRNVLTIGKETISWTGSDTGEGTGWRKWLREKNAVQNHRSEKHRHRGQTRRK